MAFLSSTFFRPKGIIMVCLLSPFLWLSKGVNHHGADSYLVQWFAQLWTSTSLIMTWLKQFLHISWDLPIKHIFFSYPCFNDINNSLPQEHDYMGIWFFSIFIMTSQLKVTIFSNNIHKIHQHWRSMFFQATAWLLLEILILTCWIVLKIIKDAEMAVARWSVERKNTNGPVLFQETLIEK